MRVTEVKNIVKTFMLSPTTKRELQLKTYEGDDIKIFIAQGEVDVEINSQILREKIDINDFKFSSSSIKLMTCREINFAPDKTICSDQTIYFNKGFAKLYIEIFKVLKDKVDLIIKHKGGVIYAYHADSSVYYVQDGKLIKTNLQKLYNGLKDMEIVNYNPALIRIPGSEYINLQKKYFDSLGKTLEVVKG